MQNTDIDESPRNGIFRKPSRIPAKRNNGIKPPTPVSSKNPGVETQLCYREKKKLHEAHTQQMNDLNKSVLNIEEKLSNFNCRKKQEIAPISADQLVGDLLSPCHLQQLKVNLRKVHNSSFLMCEKFLKLNQQLSDGHKLLVIKSYFKAYLNLSNNSPFSSIQGASMA